MKRYRYSGKGGYWEHLAALAERVCLQENLGCVVHVGVAGGSVHAIMYKSDKLHALHYGVDVVPFKIDGLVNLLYIEIKAEPRFRERALFIMDAYSGTTDRFDASVMAMGGKPAQYIRNVLQSDGRNRLEYWKNNRLINVCVV